VGPRTRTPRSPRTRAANPLHVGVARRPDGPRSSHSTHGDPGTALAASVGSTAQDITAQAAAQSDAVHTNRAVDFNWRYFD
jgi:hypothetical protein